MSIFVLLVLLARPDTKWHITNVSQRQNEDNSSHDYVTAY